MSTIINGSSPSITFSDSTTQSTAGLTGSTSQLCQAWGSYAYVANGSVPTLRKAYNISSITRSSTGVYVFAFTTALADANYSCVAIPTVGSSTSIGFASATTKSTSSATITLGYSNGSALVAFDYGVDFAIND